MITKAQRNIMDVSHGTTDTGGGREADRGHLAVQGEAKRDTEAAMAFLQVLSL